MARCLGALVVRGVKQNTSGHEVIKDRNAPTTPGTTNAAPRRYGTTPLFVGYVVKVGEPPTLGKPTMYGRATQLARLRQRIGRATFADRMNDSQKIILSEGLPPAGINGGWGQKCGDALRAYPDSSAPPPRAGQGKKSRRQKRTQAHRNKQSRC